MRTYIRRDKFDFELGYLTKSPCLTCKNQDKIPHCQEGCPQLDKIRTLLARGISTQAKGLGL